ncbi:AAA family ATPase [Nocardia sp. NPDC052566]|uniref:nucleotide-binding protein n=1 Tax=Nocardia sp. NPDC052566 TaxID=3364330 RepID=UPI0037C617FD
MQNLPHEDLIDDTPAPRRGRFKSRGTEGERPEPRPEKKRKGWLRGREEQGGQEQPAPQGQPPQLGPRSYPDAQEQPPQARTEAPAPPVQHPDSAWQSGPERAEGARQGLPTRNPRQPSAAFQPLGAKPAEEPAPTEAVAPERPELPPQPPLPDPPATQAHSPQAPPVGEPPAPELDASPPWLAGPQHSWNETESTAERGPVAPPARLEIPPPPSEFAARGEAEPETTSDDTDEPDWLAGPPKAEQPEALESDSAAAGSAPSEVGSGSETAPATDDNGTAPQRLSDDGGRDAFPDDSDPEPAQRDSGPITPGWVTSGAESGAPGRPTGRHRLPPDYQVSEAAAAAYAQLAGGSHTPSEHALPGAPDEPSRAELESSSPGQESHQPGDPHPIPPLPSESSRDTSASEPDLDEPAGFTGADQPDPTAHGPALDQSAAPGSGDSELPDWATAPQGAADHGQQIPGGPGNDNTVLYGRPDWAESPIAGPPAPGIDQRHPYATDQPPQGATGPQPPGSNPSEATMVHGRTAGPHAPGLDHSSPYGADQHAPYGQSPQPPADYGQPGVGPHAPGFDQQGPQGAGQPPQNVGGFSQRVPDSAPLGDAGQSDSTMVYGQAGTGPHAQRADQQNPYGSQSAQGADGFAQQTPGSVPPGGDHAGTGQSDSTMVYGQPGVGPHAPGFDQQGPHGTGQPLQNVGGFSQQVPGSSQAGPHGQSPEIPGGYGQQVPGAPDSTVVYGQAGTGSQAPGADQQNPYGTGQSAQGVGGFVQQAPDGAHAPGVEPGPHGGFTQIPGGYGQQAPGSQSPDGTVVHGQLGGGSYAPGADHPGVHGQSPQGAVGYGQPGVGSTAPGGDQAGAHGQPPVGTTGYGQPGAGSAAPGGQAPQGYGQPGVQHGPQGPQQIAYGTGQLPPWGVPGGQQAGYRPQQGPPPSLDDVPLRRATKAPGSGWRKAVHHASRGAINPGMSAEEQRLQELVARIRQPVRGDYRIAVLSLKGGVGKTTTTMGLGSTFASIRGDRVIAVDANPDFGTLSQRVPLQTRSTVRDLLLDPAIQRYSDVRRHTSQATSRLEVLASERDPAASEAFSEDEYRAVARVLQRFYNIILTDCGTGLMHSAMSGVLDLAHSLVLISSPAIDGARSAAATLDWLSLHGHDHLVRNAVVVINSPRAGSPNVGIQQLREYFLSRCRAVHIIPFDSHMSEGAEIDLHRLNKQTKRAYVELAATVADDFATDHRRFDGR